MKRFLFSGVILGLLAVTLLNSLNTVPTQAAVKETSGNTAHLQKLLKRALAPPEPNPVVGIACGTDYTTVTAKAIENANGRTNLIHKGDTVLIKPNICILAAAGAPTITDYRTVQAIADLTKQAGAAKIIVAEGSIFGNAFDNANLKMNKYNTIKGVQLINLNAITKKDCYQLKPAKSLTGAKFFIPKVYMDADVVINVAKLKTHFQPEAVVSLSLKNCFGVPPLSIYGPPYKGGLHNLGLKETIVDLNRIRKPDLSVIEGIVGGEGYGPSDNTPVKSNIIFAGKDLVALDTVASTFMGFKVSQIPHISLAAQEQLGIADLNKIKIIGADLNAIKMSFKH